MVQVVSFINMKGGVGKTTLAVNVAYALAYVHKKKVLIVDDDPQFNATQYLLSDDEYLKHIEDKKKATLLEVFAPRKLGAINTVTGSAKSQNKGRMPLSACTCSIFDGGAGRGKLDLMPSTLALIDIETSKRGTENKLKAYLNEKAQGYDYVIIDCPPTISVFTQAAILASDKYLVPIKPDPLSVIGLPLLERWLDDFTDDAGMSIERIGLVFTLVRGPLPNRMREVMDDLRAKRNDEVFDTHLSLSTHVAQSVEAHQPVFLYSPGVKTAHQVLGIAKEFLNRTSGD
jgi:chromosome partitioning protein